MRNNSRLSQKCGSFAFLQYPLIYDAASQALEVEFKSHAVYQYYNVPENIWLELEAAPSKGKYYSSQIRDRFLSQRIS